MQKVSHSAVCIGMVLILAGEIVSLESPSIGSTQVFPSDNPWNWDISTYPVHPNSEKFVASIGKDTKLHPDFGTVWNGAPNGIPYTVVRKNEPSIPIIYTAYGNQSDPGPFPIPLDAPIEGGPQGEDDRHVIGVDTDNGILYELYRAFPKSTNWEAESGAQYNLASNELRPETWTSADAAGLPIFPGLVRYEEVITNKRIEHALRFTVERTQKKYIWPARHYASSLTNPNLPPMGLRFRLKASVDISGFSDPIKVILTALKKYGMLVADNGGDWFISGAPDDRWDDDVLREIKNLTGSDFEAVQTVDSNGNPLYPSSNKWGHKKNRIEKNSTFQIIHQSNKSITIAFKTEKDGPAHISMVNILGQDIPILNTHWLKAGTYELQIKPSHMRKKSFTAGCYLLLYSNSWAFHATKIIVSQK